MSNFSLECCHLCKDLQTFCDVVVTHRISPLSCPSVGKGRFSNVYQGE